MIRLLVLALLSTSLTCTRGQKLALGKCPHLTVKYDFKLVKYLGVWYQKATFGTELFQGKGKCVTATYSSIPNTNVVKVINQQQPGKSLLPTMSSITGSAVLEDPTRKPPEGKLLVTLLTPVGNITSPYWVLGTDYKSWAVVYSCIDIGFIHITSGWILSRYRTLDQPEDDVQEQQVALVLQQAGLTRSMFTDTVQVNCIN